MIINAIKEVGIIIFEILKTIGIIICIFIISGIGSFIAHILWRKYKEE